MPRAVGLPFLRAVDAVEADTFRVVVGQYFDGVTIEDGDDEARAVSNGSGGR
jgi:putative IMPACT (imprinted ancient) family translation regulator